MPEDQNVLMGLDNTSLMFLISLVCFSIWYKSRATSNHPDPLKVLSWIGKGRGPFSRIRAQLSGLKDLRVLLDNGYAKFSKTGKTFVLPAFPGVAIILPRSHVKWVSEQPNSSLSATAMQVEFLQFDRTLLDHSIVDDLIHVIPVKKELTKQMPSFIPAVQEDIAIGIDQYFGTDTENWKEMHVLDTSMKLIARAANRIFVGAPICRNEEYLDAVAGFSNSVAAGGVLIRIMPKFLRPFLSWIFTLPNRWYHYKASKHLMPLVRQRIDDLKASGINKSLPNDYTTWITQEYTARKGFTKKTAKSIVNRLMAINFVNLHTSTFTSTNALFDIFSSPTTESDIQELREEIELALAESEGKWDKVSFAQLVKLDSALRESMRFSTFMTWGMFRKVVDPKGITTEDGLHVPEGSLVGTAAYSIHRDEGIYKNANTYEIFRFCAGRDTDEKTGDSGSKQQPKQLTSVTTSDIHLPFGHGKHACPGRFFATAEIKLLLAYIILNYDVQRLPERPEAQCAGETILPPMKEKLTIRRRKL